MAKQNNDPTESQPFWPKHFMYHAIAIISVAVLLSGLALFGLQDQVISDPIYTSAVPQPDWLFLMLFQVTRYFRDGLEMVGVFWIPLFILAGLILLPFVDGGAARKKWFQRAVISVSLICFLALMVVTTHSSSTTPLWSCAACHKKGFGSTFATAPERVADFYTIYDNKWLAIHYQYPQYFWMLDADPPRW